MSTSARRRSGARLHTSRSQFDESFQQIGGGTRAANGVPKSFPCFVSFPVVAVIEKVDPVQVLATPLPPAGRKLARRRRLGYQTKPMPTAVAHRVRCLPGHIGIRRELDLDDQSRGLLVHESAR